MTPSATNSRNAPLTESTFLILLTLVTPRHGYAIMQEVTRLSDQRVKLGPGTLYGALTNLAEKGYILQEGVAESGDERRKVYALTETGRELVAHEMTRLEELVAIARHLLNS